MELEERIAQLENHLALIKVDIKQVLVELKALALRDQNPLSSESEVIPAPKSPGIVVFGMPGGGSS